MLLVDTCRSVAKNSEWLADLLDIMNVDGGRSGKAASSESLRQRKAHPSKDKQPAPRALDEDEQEAVIRELQRDADRSNAAFRVVFLVLSVVIAAAVLYLGLTHGRLTLRQPSILGAAGASSGGSAWLSGQTVFGVSALATSVLIVLQAVSMWRFRPLAVGPPPALPVDLPPPATKPRDDEPSSSAAPPAPAVLEGMPPKLRRSIAGDRWFRCAVVVAALGLFANFVVADEHDGLVTFGWHCWPLLYHMAARMCATWMQEMEDGIRSLEGLRYHFKTL